LKEGDFEVLRSIGGGRGSFSKVSKNVTILTMKVYKVKKRDSNEVYAMKVMKTELISEEVKTFKHPFVVELLHSFKDENRVYFIYQYVGGKKENIFVNP
jgi:serine/threonine protein kinase